MLRVAGKADVPLRSFGIECAVSWASGQLNSPGIERTTAYGGTLLIITFRRELQATDRCWPSWRQPIGRREGTWAGGYFQESASLNWCSAWEDERVWGRWPVEIGRSSDPVRPPARVQIHQRGSGFRLHAHVPLEPWNSFDLLLPPAPLLSCLEAGMRFTNRAYAMGARRRESGEPSSAPPPPAKRARVSGPSASLPPEPQAEISSDTSSPVAASPPATGAASLVLPGAGSPARPAGGPLPTPGGRGPREPSSLREYPGRGYDILTAAIPPVDLRDRRGLSSEGLTLQAHREAMELNCSLRALSDRLAREAHGKKRVEESLGLAFQRFDALEGRLRQKTRELDEVSRLRDEAQEAIDRLEEEKAGLEADVGALQGELESVRTLPVQLERVRASLRAAVAGGQRLSDLWEEEKERNATAAREAVEAYKASDSFQEEVAECSLGAVDFGFSLCRNLVRALLPDLDLSSVTRRTADRMGVTGDEAGTSGRAASGDDVIEGASAP